MQDVSFINRPTPYIMHHASCIIIINSLRHCLGPVDITAKTVFCTDDQHDCAGGVEGEREDEKEEEKENTGVDQQQYMDWDHLQEDYDEVQTFIHEAVDMEELSGQEALVVTDPIITEYNSDKSWESAAITALPNMGSMSV